MKKNKSVNLLCVLLITGIFSCTQSPNTLSPLESNTTVINNNLNQDIILPNKPVTEISTIDNNKISDEILSNDNKQIEEPLSIGSTFDSDEIKNTLISYQDMDSVFNESENITQNSDDTNYYSDFSVKSTSMDSSFSVKKNNKNEWKLDEQSKNHLSENIEKLRNDLQSQKKLSESTKQISMTKKTIINNQKSNLLTVHKNDQVKCSNEVVIKTSNGDTVKNNEIEFKGNGIVRVNRSNRTYKAETKKLSKITHSYESRNSEYNQIAVRVITFNTDGGRTESTECTQKFNNGKIRIIQETRTINKMGNGKGIGFIKINFPGGKSCNYNLNIDLNDSGVSSHVKDPSANTEVKLDRFKNGKSRLLCRGKISDIEIDKEIVVVPSPTPTPSIVATATPTQNDNTQPYPEVTPTVTATTTVNPTNNPTSIPTATSTPTPIVVSTPTATVVITASPTATVKPTPTPTIIPTATPTPKVHDDNGHGNDEGDCDTSNPGNSNPDCIRQ